ncbi:glia maturation factor gamma isoform X1 [Microtus pennsylvanicus]|uniref:glia maturation factor gamma isoform X1 n=1 Tax=Microtus pennsylvanicus TaxID=10058 RepID=UPI003F6AD553
MEIAPVTFVVILVRPQIVLCRGSRSRLGSLWSLLASDLSDSLVVCEVDPELKEKLRKFRFRKETDNAAIIMKVDKDRQMVVLEEEFQNISPEELRSELPERQPRFVVYSYKYVHADGRVSYPLCFIFSSPVGCKPEQQMMYAGSKNRLVQTAELTKVFEIRTTDDLTESWLQEKLAFFR